MGRTTKDFVFSTPVPQALTDMVHNYLTSEGYKYKMKKNEGVYQKGAGLMMGPTFIKLSVINNCIRLEGWQEMAVLPGVYVGEIEIESFVGVAVKGPLKERFATVEDMIIRFGGAPAVPGMAYQPQYQQMPPQYQSQYQQMPPQQYQQMPQQQYPQQYQQAPAQYPPQQYVQPYQQPAPSQMPAQPVQPVQPRPERVRKVCAYCGAVSEDGMKFCMSCGSMLD